MKVADNNNKEYMHLTPNEKIFKGYVLEPKDRRYINKKLREINNK